MPPRWGFGSQASSTAPTATCLQDDDGQTAAVHSVSAGSTIRAWGRNTVSGRTPAGALLLGGRRRGAEWRSTSARGMEGILPALENRPCVGEAMRLRQDARRTT